jgi:hypothetical protein
MYYFWSVRPLNTGFGGSFCPPIEGIHGRPCFSQFLEGTMAPCEGFAGFDDPNESYYQEIDDYDRKSHKKKNRDGKEVVDLRVMPAQGMFKQSEAVEFTVSAPCPQQKQGFYACVMSLYVEQLEDASLCDICTFIQQLAETGMNDVPIHIDFLKESVEKAKKLKGKEKGRKSKDRRSLGLDLEDDVYLDQVVEQEDEEPKEEEHDEEEFHQPNEEYMGEHDEEQIEFIMPPKRKTKEHRPCIPRRKKGSSNDALGDGPLRPKNMAQNVDLLRPIVEIEIWLRAISLDIVFSPPFIVACGVVNSRIERRITVTNESQWPVEITWTNVMDSVASVCVQPASTLSLDPLEQATFSAIVCLKRHGKVTLNL